MNSVDLIKYIENPGLLDKESLVQIEKLLSDYPYFQTAHKLYLKNLKQISKNDFILHLSSSVFIAERDLLYYYLNSPQEEFPNDKLQSLKKDVIIAEESKTETPETVIQVDKLKEENKDKGKTKLLKNQNVRRKIKEGVDGMGDNISVTISSQIEFVKSNRKEELEYSPEIYFIDDEKPEKNKIITIDATPDQSINKNGKDLLQIDESKEIEKDISLDGENDNGLEGRESIELIETAEKIQESKNPKSKQKSNQGFDISQYADEDEILKGADENDLISKFITINPRIEPVDTYTNDQKDISEHSIKEDDNLLTETLAKVYIFSGYFEKAIKSYEKLCLKYPEKNTYFAGQIEIIKELLNKQKNI